MVAMSRIQAFLICDEVNESIIKEEFSETAAVRISDQSNFHWGLKMKPDLAPRRGGRRERRNAVED